jgi:hypothetical protein
MGASNVDVLLISGSGRSGSTLLLRILGSADGYCAIGELNNIWGKSLLKNQLCGCGQPFNQCPFWRAVMDEAFGGMEHVDAQQLLDLRNATVRAKHLPLHMFPPLQSATFRTQVRDYSQTLERIYAAIKTVSGCDVIVDSSKSPGHAFVVAGIPSLRGRIIHMVRDSRATTFSWTRKKKRQDVSNATEYMLPRGHLEMAMQWNLKHICTPLAARKFDGYGVCRYEDFAARPRHTVQRLLGTLELDDAGLGQFVSDREVLLRDDHCLWGNPDRFNRGKVVIKSDDEWQTRMPALKKAQVTLLTLPWLIKYRYLRGDARTQHAPTEDMVPAMAGVDQTE